MTRSGIVTSKIACRSFEVGDGPKTTARWNSTEVYQRINGSWKIIHSHWSYVKPDLNESNEARNADVQAIRTSETVAQGLRAVSRVRCAAQTDRRMKLLPWYPAGV